MAVPAITNTLRFSLRSLPTMQQRFFATGEKTVEQWNKRKPELPSGKKPEIGPAPTDGDVIHLDLSDVINNPEKYKRFGELALNRHKGKRIYSKLHDLKEV